VLASPEGYVTEFELDNAQDFDPELNITALSLFALGARTVTTAPDVTALLNGLESLGRGLAGAVLAVIPCSAKYSRVCVTVIVVKSGI
jgi:hypothetical protein